MSDETVQEPGGRRLESTASDFENSETVIADHSDLGSFLRRQVPYISVLGLAIVGVAYTNMAHQPLVGYWEFLALATGVVCIITEWPKLDGRQAHLRLIWMQSVHWVAVLVAMNVMLLSSVQQFVPTPATSLVLLILLALGTFLADFIYHCSRYAFWVYRSPWRCPLCRGSNSRFYSWC
jgi:hypothetical protein